jgi:hypothetical protein
MIFFYSGMWKKSLVKKDIPKLTAESSKTGSIDNTVCE